MNRPPQYSRAFLDAFNAAHKLHNDKRYSEAEAAYRRALRIHPNVALANANLGSAIFAQGRHQEALIFQRKAITLDQNLAFGHANVGLTLIAMERYDEAMAAFRMAIEINPKDQSGYNNFGDALLQIGKFEEAIEQLEKALAIDPQSFQALHNISVAHFRLHQFDAAIEYLDRAVAITPNNIGLLSILVISQRETGRSFDQALLRLVQAQPENQGDLQTKVWATLLAGHPKIAFSIKPAGLCILDYEDLGRLYRPSDLADRLASLPEVTGSWPQANGRPLITASADGKYAEMFAAELIESVLATCPGCDFHLHLMNPGNFQLKDYPPGRVTCATEIIPGGERTVYSTRRFLRLPDLLARTGRPVISVDMDSIFMRDVAGALPQQFDVLFYERRDQPWPQQMVNAGFLAIAPTGVDFANFLAAYILHFEEKGNALWFVDQLGIVSATAWFRRNVSTFSILAAPPQMMDWSGKHNPECVIRHYKGALKTTAERSR